MEATATNAIIDIRDVLIEFGKVLQNIERGLEAQNKNHQRFRSEEQARKRESPGF